MPKRTLILLLIIAFLIGGATYLVYQFYLAPDEARTEDSGGFFSFFPFGNRGQLPEERPSGTATSTPTGTGEPIVLPVLRQLSSEPQSGAIATSTNGELFVRYVARGTGHVYEVAATSTTHRRISNTTIPQVQEALFDRSGTRIMLRYLKDGTDVISTFLGKLEKAEASSTEEVLSGSFLPSNIKQAAWNPAGTKLFYLLTNADGAFGTVLDMATGSQSGVFASPLSEWLAEWPAADRITFTSKPSFENPGFLQALDLKTGAATIMRRGIRGLTARANQNGEYVLYGESKNRQSFLTLYKTSNGAVRQFPLQTLPEKCVWSETSPFAYCAGSAFAPLGNYPDDWYQGTLSFTDDIWRISGENGTMQLVYSLDAASGPIDATNLFLTPDEGYLMFTNKRDSMLWSLDLDRASEDPL